MTEPADLLDSLHDQILVHVELALVAEAEPVAAMHIDLAAFSAEQMRLAEELRDDG